MPAAIRVQNLRKVYGAKAAVDGLDLEVPRGCFFGFLGPNGAGKTTTIRMLMGLAPPTSGTIELLGLAMPEHALEVKGKIGLVPDESLLFDHLTGPEFTEFVGRMYGLERGVARERSRELLELFDALLAKPSAAKVEFRVRTAMTGGILIDWEKDTLRHEMELNPDGLIEISRIDKNTGVTGNKIFGPGGAALDPTLLNELRSLAA